MIYLFFLLGLVLLVVGAEGFVRGSTAIARKLGVSPLLIGLTLVGFGTSAPELVISIDAALRDAPGLVMGNIVGTNTANILLILGLGAAITPVAVHRSVLRRDGGMLMIATLAAVGVVLYGTLSRLAGIVFLVLLTAYIVHAYVSDKRAVAANPQLRRKAEAEISSTSNTALAVLMAIGGLALILVGARLLVDSAIEIARTLGVSDTLIGLTIVAVGTSSPEIAITIISAIKRQTELALGNIIGSNIFNILGILGITAVVQPLAIPPQIATLDIWVMAGATIALMLAAYTGRVIKRWEGWAFLALYAAYLAWLILTA